MDADELIVRLVLAVFPLRNVPSDIHAGIIRTAVLLQHRIYVECECHITSSFVGEDMGASLLGYACCRHYKVIQLYVIVPRHGSERQSYRQAEELAGSRGAAVPLSYLISGRFSFVLSFAVFTWTDGGVKCF